MPNLLISVIIALFAFVLSLAGSSALPHLQQAQERIVASISEIVDEENDENGEDEDGSENDEDGSEDNNENEDGSENGDENGEDENDENGDENGDQQEPDTNRVRAFNSAAGFVLPTLVPQVAVNNSPVLLGCDEEGADCEDTSPGKSNGNSVGNNNANNGNIGLAKAKSVKSVR